MRKVLLLHLIMYIVVYVVFKNYDQNLFILDSIVICFAIFSFYFNLKWFNIIIISSFIFFIISPFDLLENITLNKFQYILNISKQLFNHNYLLPIVYSLFVIIIMLFITSIIIKISAVKSS